jgi:hypothetical protein
MFKAFCKGTISGKVKKRKHNSYPFTKLSSSTSFIASFIGTWQLVSYASRKMTASSSMLAATEQPPIKIM